MTGAAVLGLARASVVASLGCLCVTAAHAADDPTRLSLPAAERAPHVMLVRPVSVSSAVTETLSRLHGELLSVGLEVELAARPAAQGVEGASSRGWLEGMAIERGLDAAIDVVGEGTPSAVDVWVFEREPRRAAVTRVVAEPEPENAPERLAIRSIDVLRSILIEHHLLADRSGPPRATVALAGTETDRPPETVRRVGIELGATVLRSLDGVGPVVSPVVRVDWAVRSWLVLQAELAGLGSQPTVEAPGGTARVAQEHAVFGVCDCLSARRLHPTFALSAGLLQTSADGHASSPAQGHATRHRSFLLQASVGARLALGGRYEMALAAHAQVAEPYVAIAVLDQVAATVGRPNLLMSLTLGGWL